MRASLAGRVAWNSLHNLSWECTTQVIIAHAYSFVSGLLFLVLYYSMFWARWVGLFAPVTEHLHAVQSAHGSPLDASTNGGFLVPKVECHLRLFVFLPSRKEDARGFGKNP